jgi:hypothetical protein
MTNADDEEARRRYQFAFINREHRGIWRCWRRSWICAAKWPASSA